MSDKPMKVDYEITVEYHGNGEKALEFIRQVFANANFDISPASNGAFEVVNAHMMMSNHENALRAVSRASIVVGGSSITIQAEVRNGRMLYLLLGVMMLLLGLIFTVTLPNTSVWISFAPLAPWIVILPLMSRATTRAARKALDTLLNNAANAA